MLVENVRPAPKAACEFTKLTDNVIVPMPFTVR